MKRRNLGIRTACTVFCMLVTVGVIPQHAAAETESATASVSGRAAFDRLKSLEGEWVDKDGETNEIRVSADGNVVIEKIRLGPGGEMISMYHLDSDKLLMDHYCIMGNRPELVLTSEDPTSTELLFTYVDGSNLDPQKDSHIHAWKILFYDEGHFASEFTVFKEGKPSGRFLQEWTRAESKQGSMNGPS